MGNKIYCGNVGVSFHGKQGDDGSRGYSIYTSNIDPISKAFPLDLSEIQVGDYIYCPGGLYKRTAMNSTDTSINANDFTNIVGNLHFKNSGSYLTFKDAIVRNICLNSKTLHDTSFSSDPESDYITYGQAEALPSLGSFTVDNSWGISGYPYKFYGEGITSFNELKYFNNESITGIPAGMFENCSLLESIVLPPYATSVGDAAFKNCSLLDPMDASGKWIFNESNLTALGYQSFYGCSSLEQFDLNGIKGSIPSECFEGCSSLSKMTGNSGITFIGQRAYKDCTSLSTADISTCTSLGGVVDGVETTSATVLSDETFAGCTSLSKAYLPANISKIGVSAFAGDTTLADISIYDVSSIGANAFRGCTALSNIYLDKEYSHPESMSIGANAIYGDTKAKFRIPSGRYYACASSDAWAAYYDEDPAKSKMLPYDWLVDINFIYTDPSNGVTTDTPFAPDYSLLKINGTEYKPDKAGSVNFKTMDGSGNNSYYNIGTSSNPTKVTVSLNDYDASSLIPETPYGETFDISGWVFRKTFRYVPDVIGFADGYLLQACIDAGYDTNGNRQISSKEALNKNDGSLSNKITTLDYNVFQNGKYRSYDASTKEYTPTDLYYRDIITSYDELGKYFRNITSMGGSASTAPLANYTALKSVSIPYNVCWSTDVSNGLDYAFYNDSNLATITSDSSGFIIPNVSTNSLTSLNYTFYNTALATGPSIPSKVTSMNYTYYDCSKMTTADIGNGTVRNLDHTFYNCINLNSVTGTISLDASSMNYTFYKAGITEGPDITKGNVQSMIQTFTSCPNLTNAYIGNKVSSFDNTFADCYKLATINGSTNTFVDASATNIDGIFANCGFKNCPIIPSNVTSMASTFIGCSQMSVGCISQGINTHNGLKSTFENTGITSLKDGYAIPNNAGLTTLESTFKNTMLTTAPSIPANITALITTFSNCPSLSSATIGNGVQQMNGAFQSSGLTTISIPSNVSGDFESFADCSKLKTCTINATGTLRGSFKSCTSLDTVTINTSNINLYSTFQSCTSLSKVYLTATTAILDASVFENCSSLKEIHIYNTNPSKITIDKNTFLDVSTNIKVIVPSKYLFDYRKAWGTGTGYNLTDSIILPEDCLVYLTITESENRFLSSSGKNIATYNDASNPPLECNISNSFWDYNSNKTYYIVPNGSLITLTSKESTDGRYCYSTSADSESLYSASLTGIEHTIMEFKTPTLYKIFTDSTKAKLISFPILSENGTLGGSSFAVDVSAYSYSGEAYYIFDGNEDTIWTYTSNGYDYPNDSTPAPVSNLPTQGGNYGHYLVNMRCTFYNPTAFYLLGFHMTTKTPNSIYSTTIQGSNDNSTWTTILTKNLWGWEFIISPNSTIAYKYYKISVTDLRPYSTTDTTGGISDIKLYGI